jgi:hypothetical protein
MARYFIGHPLRGTNNGKSSDGKARAGKHAEDLSIFDPVFPPALNLPVEANKSMPKSGTEGGKR